MVVVVARVARHTSKVIRNPWLATILVSLVVHIAFFAMWRGWPGGSSLGAFLRVRYDVPQGLQHAHPVSSLAEVELVTNLPDVAPSIPEAANDSAQSDVQSASGPASRFVAAGQKRGRRAALKKGIQLGSQRHDRSARSKARWNHLIKNQEQHLSPAPRGTSFSESIDRAPKSGYSNRPLAKVRARRGQDREQPGLAKGGGHSGATGRAGAQVSGVQPESMPPRVLHKRAVGAVKTNLQRPLLEKGRVSGENLQRGKDSQWASAVALSNRRHASSFDLGAPSSGGTSGLGAGGRRGRSVANQGTTGLAAIRASNRAAKGTTTRATRSNPYFYAMYQRIDKELVFPRKLARALEQGEVVLRFELVASGEVRSLVVAMKSDFPEFDAEALRAFKAAAPFGPVPKALLSARGTVRVVAPYYFRNPLIR